MEASKEYIKEEGIYPRISFKDKPIHEVELIKDRKLIIQDPRTGEDIKGIEYAIREDDEIKTFFTSSKALIAKLAQYKKGDKVKIEFKKYKDAKTGEWRNTYSVGGLDGEVSVGGFDDRLDDINPEDLPM